MNLDPELTEREIFNLLCNHSNALKRAITLLAMAEGESVCDREEMMAKARKLSSQALAIDSEIAELQGKVTELRKNATSLRKAAGKLRGQATLNQTHKKKAAKLRVKRIESEMMRKARLLHARMKRKLYWQYKKGALQRADPPPAIKSTPREVVDEIDKRAEMIAKNENEKSIAREGHGEADPQGRGVACEGGVPDGGGGIQDNGMSTD